jgi:hypothetical protein
MESTEPDNLWLFNLNPVLVLGVPSLEVFDPVHEILLVLRGLVCPAGWQEAVEHAVGKLIE